MAVRDLSVTPVDRRRSETERYFRRIRGEPFSLEHGPLFRIELLKFSDRHHVLLLSVHHVITDLWSMRVLTREFGLLYQGFEEGGSSTLPDLSIQYADYAVWQRRRMESPSLRAELDYWRAQLAGAPVALNLPLHRPRPAIQIP